MKRLAQTAAQKKYSAACDAARSWAANVAPDELRRGNADRVSRSYGISEADALSIIVKAHRERRP